MKEKQSIIKFLILAVILAVALTAGFATGAMKTAALTADWTLSLRAILRLAAMAAGVLLAEWVAEFFLTLCKPRTHRARSILSITRSLLRYAAAIVILCWGLHLLGVNILAIVASLGVLALIVGFAADSIIADLVTGVFILFDSQYNVGDIIEVDGFRGVVTDIGIRTTSITDASENIKIVNNADMRNILNRSDHVSKSFCDISIPYTCDLEALEEKFPSLLEEIRQKRADVMLDTPVYLGVQQLADSAVVLRFCVDVKEKDIYGGARAVRGSSIGICSWACASWVWSAPSPSWTSTLCEPWAGRICGTRRRWSGAHRQRNGNFPRSSSCPGSLASRRSPAPGRRRPRFPRSFRAAAGVRPGIGSAGGAGGYWPPSPWPFC